MMLSTYCTIVTSHVAQAPIAGVQGSRISAAKQPCYTVPLGSWRLLVNNRIRLVQAAEDGFSEQQRAEEMLRATACQQEAVAHLSQQALAGAPVAALMDEAVAIVARALDIEYVGLLEFRPESRSLLLRAGVGWDTGCVGRTVLPADGDQHWGYALRSGTPWWWKI